MVIRLRPCVISSPPSHLLSPPCVVHVVMEGTVTCMEFYKSTHLLTGSEDHAVCIWRVHDWALLHVLGGHKGAVTSLRYLLLTRHLVCCYVGTICGTFLLTRYLVCSYVGTICVRVALASLRYDMNTTAVVYLFFPRCFVFLGMFVPGGVTSLRYF